jgi:hypothetical protein
MIQNILNSIDVLQLFRLEFWFRNPGSASVSEFAFWLVVFIATILLGVLIFLFNKVRIGYYPPKNKILKPASAGFLIIGAVGIMFSLFRWQTIDFLGVRAPLLLTIIAALAWGAFFLYSYRKKVPDQSVKYETIRLKQKYLAR